MLSLILVFFSITDPLIPYPAEASFPASLKSEDGAVGCVAASGKLALPDTPAAHAVSIAETYRGVSFIFPVAGADFRSIEYTWRSGLSDFRNMYRNNHDGCDIFARVGTPVLAAADGVVEISCWTGGKGPGNKICVDHGNGFFTYYLHMSNRSVEKGEKVMKGQVIGTVGASGNARGTPAHLHFEIDPGVEGTRRPSWYCDYVNVQPGLTLLRSIDPLPYIVEKTVIQP